MAKKPAGLGAPVIASRGSKVMVYGMEGTGKTEFMMSLCKYMAAQDPPGQVFILDTEGRTQYYAKDGYQFEVLYSVNPFDLLELLDYVEDLHSQGHRVALGVDSFSGIWFEQQEVAETLGATRSGNATFSSWGPAKKPLKKFYARVFRTPIDVVITARAKPRYEQEANTKKVIDYGYDIADVEKGLRFVVDLALEMRKDELKPGTPLKPKDFWALVTKTSGPAEDNPLPIGTQIRNPNFAKVSALRLNGNNGSGLQFADAKVGLQVMRAAITNSSDLIAWTQQNLGWSKDDTLGRLKEQFGDLKPHDLGRYIEWVYEVSQNGHELEAA